MPPMRSYTFVVAVLTLGFVLRFAAPSAGQQPEQHDHPAPAGGLGAVHFATSCAPAVQKEFDRGVALLHSFWFSAAIESFNTVLKGDPRCVMAHWGIAMSWWGNPFAGFRSPQALQAGLAATDAAKRQRRRHGSREGLRRRGRSPVPRRGDGRSTRAGRSRTRRRWKRSPPEYADDVEARIFYALALDQTALPTDKTYANQLKAAGILEDGVQAPARASRPRALHHSQLRRAGAGAARARRRTALREDRARRRARAPHAVPHVHARGLLAGVDRHQPGSAAAARKDSAAAEELHALDYQAYAYLQTAQDAAARRTLDAIAPLGCRRLQTSGAGNAAPPPAGYYALAAIPARYALEREAWAEAAALQPHETPFAWADAVTHFARALGAARSGNAAAARQDIDRLAALRDALKQGQRCLLDRAGRDSAARRHRVGRRSPKAGRRTR